MYSLPPLPYDYSALEPYIDTETMKIHHDKHHQIYVDNLNKVLEGHDDLTIMHGVELMANLGKVPEEIRSQIRNNLGGVLNHNMFWQVMAPKAGGRPTNKLVDAMNAVFGDFETFQEKFSAAGLGRFGSGWAWLVVTDDGKLEIMDTPNQDNPLMTSDKPASPAGGSPVTPILCLDVWEHAYYLKYQNRRAEYIKNWWNVVNWPEVDKRFQEAL